jgi:hypothetical protein
MAGERPHQANGSHIVQNAVIQDLRTIYAADGTLVVIAYQKGLVNPQP